MAKGKKSVLVYVDWMEQFDSLSDEEAGKLIKHFFKYVNDMNPIAPDRIIELAFIPIKQSLKRDLKKWEEISIKRSQSGKKAGIKSGESRRTKLNQNEPIGSKSNQNEHVSDSVSVSDNDINNNTVTVVPFEVFWDLYDKKVDAKACKPKWEKLKDAEKQAVLNYIPKYKLSQPDKKFRKNPETFLNRRSWENELIVEAKRTEKGKQAPSVGNPFEIYR